jgi:hypothetical protein
MTNLNPSPLPAEVPTVELPIPTYTLFDSASVTLATIFGSPVAGTILMAINYHRLGEGSSAAVAIVCGLLATGFAIAFGNLVPQTATTVVALALVIGMRTVAQAVQGSAVQQHINRGGKLASKWAALGIGVATLVVIVAIVFVAVGGKQLDSIFSSKVTIGIKDEVYYSGTATKQDAQALGDRLKGIGYFTDRGVTAKLSKGKDGTAVSFVVKDGAWNQPEMISSFEDIGRQIAPSVGGFPIKVRMMTTESEIKKDLTVGKVIIGTQDEIYYYGNVTEADAKTLGQSLKTAGYLQDRGVTVLLSKNDEGTAVSFIVKQGYWGDPAGVAGFENLVRQIASSIGGPPIKLRLADSQLETKKEIQVQ